MSSRLAMMEVAVAGWVLTISRAAAKMSRVKVGKLRMIFCSRERAHRRGEWQARLAVDASATVLRCVPAAAARRAAHLLHLAIGHTDQPGRHVGIHILELCRCPHLVAAAVGVDGRGGHAQQRLLRPARGGQRDGAGDERPFQALVGLGGRHDVV